MSDHPSPCLSVIMCAIYSHSFDAALGQLHHELWIIGRFGWASDQQCDTGLMINGPKNRPRLRCQPALASEESI